MHSHYSIDGHNTDAVVLIIPLVRLALDVLVPEIDTAMADTQVGQEMPLTGHAMDTTMNCMLPATGRSVKTLNTSRSLGSTTTTTRQFNTSRSLYSVKVRA